MVDLLQARLSPMWFPVAATLLWGTQLALAVESWRSRHGRAAADWIPVLGEFEALLSLSAYAFERPADTYANVLESGDRFDGKGIGHPLIPDERCVRNDLELGIETRVYIVSGSNMSGKSTLLRTVGVNTVLALAGAPVRAESLTVSPVALGASIAVRDSLQRDISHFHAELLRLQSIVRLADQELPVLFLVDEILHGTNSRDRNIGTREVIRLLLDKNAIGLATTHDLSLGEMADELSPYVKNVHFQDDIADGRMRFDYRLRLGVVERSNALELMRQVGLMD
jgi:DNA mismatch repair ATPase MutS